MSVPAFAVAGWKDSGKTTLVERLVAHLSAEGFAVGTVKRSHDAFLMDVAGTDTDRHRSAGARKVAMVGPNGWTLATTGPEPSLAEVLSAMRDCDLVIVEGGKRADLPLIEVVADPAQPAIREANPNVFAVASDLEIDCTLPFFRRSEVAELADLALQRLDLR